MPRKKKLTQAQKKQRIKDRNKARRDNLIIRETDQRANTEAHRVTRQNPERREAEQIPNTISRRITRQNPERREAEQTPDTISRRITRQNQERRETEQIPDTILRRITRQNPERREAEQIPDTISRRITRQNSERRGAEQIPDTISRRIIRQNPERRETEQIHDTISRRITRQNPERREAEQTPNTKSRGIARQNPDYRTPERITDSQARRLARENPDYRTPEKEKDAEAHKIVRKNPVKRRILQDADTENRSKQRKVERSKFETMYEKYKEKIKCAPNIICSCCGGLWYVTSTTKISRGTLLERGFSDSFLDSVLCVDQDVHHLCVTCRKSVMAKNVPKMCLSNGFEFPIIPEELKVSYNYNSLGINEINRTLYRIFHLLRSGWLLFGSLRGNVVNVENDIDYCASVIPLKFDETSTVQVQFMRKMEYKAPYMYEIIRPKKVYTAAKYLINTELYKAENVLLSDRWALSGDGKEMCTHILNLN
jgi:hypothetical protein